MRKLRKVVPDPSHPKSQEKHTLWKSTSTFLINTSRIEPGYKRDVCDAQMTSRPFTLIYGLNIRCSLPGGRSHEYWMRPFDIVVVTCVWPWFDEREFDCGQSDWNELNGGMVRSKKQTGWETVDHWYARGGGLWSNDWLKKNRTRLQTGRVWRPSGVTPLKCLFTIIFY